MSRQSHAAYNQDDHLRGPRPSTVYFGDSNEQRDLRDSKEQEANNEVDPDYEEARSLKESEFERLELHSVKGRSDLLDWVELFDNSEAKFAVYDEGSRARLVVMTR